MYFTANGRILENGPRREQIRLINIYIGKKANRRESIACESRPAKLGESSDSASAAPGMGNVALAPDARHKEITSARAHAASPPPTTGKHPPSSTSPDPERNVFLATVARMGSDRRLIAPIPGRRSTPSETYPPP